MPKLTIDGQTVEVDAGATILDAAGRLGVHIPTLCHVPGLDASESCFVCVVRVAGTRRLVPACSMRASEGMDVTTDSDEIRAARRMAVELLLSDHLGECQAPCEMACPAHWDIPGFMEALRAGANAAAAKIARGGLALPGVLGHVCQAPCQNACRRKEKDQPLAIRELHRHLAERELPSETLRPKGTGKRVCVVGGGPAGLAAANAIAGRRHEVELFDRGEKPGGSLCELSEGELPSKVLAADVDYIRRAGVTITRAALGEKLTLGELRERFDAVILAIGGSPDLGALGELAQADGKLTVQRGTGATNLPGVFVAGALAGRGGRAIAAVADGLAVAGAVEQFLSGQAVTGRPKLANVRYGPLDEDEQALLWSRAANAGASVGKVNTERDAAAEANRCLICGCSDNTRCRLRQVAGEVGATMTRFVGERRRFARDATHPQVVYEPHKCILCGACVRIAQAAGESPGLTYVGRGFAGRVSPPYEGRWIDALGSSAAKCAQACPTSAIRPQKRFE